MKTDVGMIFIVNTYETDITTGTHALLLCDGINAFSSDSRDVMPEHRQISHKTDYIIHTPPHFLCSTANTTILSHSEIDTIHNEYSMTEETLHAAYP